MLTTAFAWLVINQFNGHFNVINCNCEEEGHSVNTCLQPKDQKKIAASEKNFSEKKQNCGRTNGGNKNSSSSDSHSHN